MSVHQSVIAHDEDGERNGFAEVDQFDNGNIFLEVYDESHGGGKRTRAAVILQPNEARLVAAHLIAAAQAAS